MKQKVLKTVDGNRTVFLYGNRDIRWPPVDSPVEEQTERVGNVDIVLDRGQHGYEQHRSVHVRSVDVPGYYIETHRFEPGKIHDPKTASRGFFEALVAAYKAAHDKRRREA